MKKKLNMIENPKNESMNRVSLVFLEHLGPVLVASSNTDWDATDRVITLNIFQSQKNLKEILQNKNKEKCVFNDHVITNISLHSYKVN